MASFIEALRGYALRNESKAPSEALRKPTDREGLIVGMLAEPLAVGLTRRKLTEREARIAGATGLFGEQEHTLQQIGDSLGLSRERVRQLEARALLKLRDSGCRQPK